LRAGELRDITIEKLSVSSGNIRKLEVEADALIPSIERDGVREPLHVYRSGDGYRIIDGQRRFLAAKKIGLKALPCLILPSVEDEVQALEFSFIQTILRKDVHPLDKARAVKELIVKLGSLEAIYEKYGIPKSTLSQWNALNNLNPVVRELVSSPGELRRGTEGLSFKLAREIARFPQESQLEITQRLLPLKNDCEIQQVLRKEKGRSLDLERKLPVLVTFSQQVYSALEKAAESRRLKKETIVEEAVAEALKNGGYLEA